MKYSPIYPLSPGCEEVVFAPFHDPELSTSLDFKLNTVSASQCEVTPFWCYTDLVWESVDPGTVACEFILNSKVRILKFNYLILCLSVPADVDFFIIICIDDEWTRHDTKFSGTGVRMEISIPLSGDSITGVKLNFISDKTGHNVVHLSWFGLQNKKLVDSLLTSQQLSEWHWDNLIHAPDDWPEIYFEKGLLFSQAHLPGLRNKKNLPLWNAHFQYLEEQANACLSRVPERELGLYLPVNDDRYIRDREKNRTPYHSEALVLGFVGLVNNDKQMMHHALRYLCCMLHIRFWVQSAESKLSGSTWDQRCFMEEMTTTSVVLLADWFAFALTDHAKKLVQQYIWDKGLATIERDMMKFEYLYHCNQGIGFSRARILGGLYLQDSWPRMGKYVERAYLDLNNIFENYLNKDGGIDEGIGYYCQSFQAALPAFIAYANYRGMDFRKILKKKFNKTLNYISAMSSTVKGKAIPAGDCRTEYLCGDVVPVFAAIFPRSIFAEALEACLENHSIYSVTGMMANSGGILGLIYGPESHPQGDIVAPGFIRLPDTGILSCYRSNEEHSVRIFFQGSRPNPSHSHLDKGSFILEIDQSTVLIDPGMSSYASIFAAKLPHSSLHNVLTPVLANNIYANQDIPSKSIIPKGHGSVKKLHAKIDLRNVWRSHMHSYTREIISERLEEFTIKDSGTLKKPGQLAFLLQSVTPFDIQHDFACLKTDKYALHIKADWAATMHQEQKISDLASRQVYTLIITSDVHKRYSFQTHFEIRFYV